MCMTERKRTDEEIQFSQALSKAVRKAPDFHTALCFALTQVCELSGWDYGEVWIPCKDNRVLVLSPVCYTSKRKGNDSVLALEQFRLCSEAFILPPATGLAGRVWSSQQPEWTPDVSAQSETYFLRNQIAKAYGLKTGLGVPILANHQVLAVLVFFMLEAREEDRRLVELVVTVATHLGEVQYPTHEGIGL